MTKKNPFPLINSGQNILGKFNAKNLLLLNTYYSQPHGETPDVATIVFKDTSTGEKKKLEIENPLMKFYVVKEELRNYAYYPEVFKRTDCDEWIVPYKDILKYILKVTTPELKQWAKWCIETKNYYSLKRLHHTPVVAGTDFPYENYFRLQWLLHYADHDIDTKITKMYLDIEVDSIDIKGMPEDGNCPINAVTLIDDETNNVYTFLLRNKKNPQIEDFENRINDFVNCCHQTFDPSYGEMKYNIYMFDEELKLIKAVFDLINILKRDFVLIWNLAFDIPYFMDRLVYLGEDPKDYICHPDFDYKYCWFMKDRRNFDFKTKKDIFRCASYTIYSDQMINYAKVRKGQAELPSLKLNSIGRTELNDEKLDYSDEANIKTLAYVDYWKFVLYNIKDVMLQMGIERKTDDLSTIFQRAYDNATDYDSVFSQTVFLKNRVAYDYYTQLDLILGNNINIKYNNRDEDEKEDEEYETDEDGEPDWTRPKHKNGFEGALVGDPMNNGHEGIKLYGVRSKFVFNYVIDLDLNYRSLYQQWYNANSFNCWETSKEIISSQAIKKVQRLVVRRRVKQLEMGNNLHG